jgi:uroporphyrinogen-III synthase
MARILITKQDNIKEFVRILEDEGHEVEGVSFLEYRPVPFDKVPDADCIFFYSRRGVDHFFQQIEQKERDIDPNVKYATLGKNTANSLSKYVEQIHFIGEGHPAKTMNAFKKWFSGDKVLAVRADHSKNRLQKVIGVDWKVEDLVVYSNEIKESLNFKEHDIATLTSPLNAKSYFKFQSAPYPKLVAIGQTTSAAISKFTDDEIFISPKPYLKEVSKFILRQIQLNWQE